VKAMLVITYLLSGRIVDTQSIDAANMEECRRTKSLALAENTPITTRYDARVKISGSCREVISSVEKY
jgi:hypothetical protein